MNKYFTTIKCFLLNLLLVVSTSVYSQTLNAYAKVTAITGGITLSLSNVNQTAHTFADGEQIVIMQMQDNVIGTTTNTNTFGSLSGTGLNVGYYEVTTIASHVGAPPTSITLSSALNNTYNINANASVQIISYQALANYTTPVGGVSALAWDGNVGGVVALQVTGTLTVTSNINADGVGFRGGSVSNNYYPGGFVCDTIGPPPGTATGGWISSLPIRGAKGESIFLRTLVSQEYGKAHILNGGGGGVNINVGGGGGSNYTAGGHSGPGWSNDAAGGCGIAGNPEESLGGIALSTITNGFRVYMGGGGGGAQQNDGAGTSGAAGGGIVLIQASVLTNAGGCGSRISANGATAANTTGGGNDGAGGGGGAGSIVLNVTTYTTAAGCALNIQANGGNGGNVIFGSTHSGGGGGGVGAIVFSGSIPPAPVTTSTSPGSGGYDQSGHTSQAQGGTTGSGVISNVTTPLPIQLVYFAGTSEGTYNKLEWETMSETNNDYFTLERSQDAVNFNSFDIVKGAGNSQWQINYTANDYQPYIGVTYYRLKQTDYNGNFTYSKTIALTNGLDNVSVDNVYPNPTNGSLNFDFHSPVNGQIHVQIFSYLGQMVLDNIENVNEGRNAVTNNIEEFAKGIYTIRITFEQTNYTFTSKVIKE